MEAIIHCVSCEASLRVAEQAVGHQIRCPACGSQFPVPALDDLVEETASAWIEQEVDEALEQKHQRIEQQLARVNARLKEAKPPEAREADQSPDRLKAAGGASDRRRSRHHASRSSQAPEDQKGGGDPARLSEQARPPAGVGKGKSALGTTQTKAGHDPDAPAPDPEAVPYPQQLHPTEPIPHLVVRKVDEEGVHFAFDVRWLNHEGFRASLPVRCVFGTSHDRQHLTARPLVFLDRAQSRHATVDHISQHHQNRMVGEKSPRRIMQAMGRLNGMRQPFDLAMPYYAGSDQTHYYLHCRTHEQPDGSVAAEVLIPDLSCALEWLGRVNGVCGEEYDLLEREASVMHGEGWKRLSETCRQRIGAWCRLHPREEVHLYLTDADFGKRDAGLAGLLLTDRRLVFSKYHHRGELALPAPDAVITARCQERFVSLTLRNGRDRSRMIKLHRHDLDHLTTALQEHGGPVLRISEESE